MAERRRKLGREARAEWVSEIELAKAFYRQKVLPTQKFSKAARDNQEHWVDSAWEYEEVTANLIYANQQSIMPRVLMRMPKVIVKPRARMTRAYARVGEAGSTDRFVASVLVQQVVNWRWREFDFTKQVRRAVRDDHDRGMGAIRHGFCGIGEKERTASGSKLETIHHKHIREGWPFAVHQSLDRYLWDQRARDLDERRWVGYMDYWRPEDAKARFNLKRTPDITHVLGQDMFHGPDRAGFVERHGDSLGYTAIWEVWDRRSGEVIFWIDKEEEELAVEDWPLEFEGLNDTVLYTNEYNDRIEPTPEPSLYWGLQQDLNKLVSLALVYAKRGVPILGFDKSGMDPAEIEKITEAEIMEAIAFKGNPNEALALMNLQPVPQTLLLAISLTQDLIREVSGQGKMTHGGRENVESATEAAEIGEGGDLRVAMRSEAVRNFCGELIRKDWQVFQQQVKEPQIIDLVAQGLPPLQIKLTPEQIKMEFDFEIEVGSSEPLNAAERKRDALALISGLQSDPRIYQQTSPRFLARLLVQAFGYDENEVLATQDAANAQNLVDKFGEAMGQGGGGAAAGGSMPALGAAQDALKSRPDNKEMGRAS